MHARMEPFGFFKRIPLEPHQMTQRITAIPDLITLCHLGVPRIEVRDWSLRIDGLVRRELILRHDDLKRYPFVEMESVHECAGSPLQPREPTRRASNIVWGGVRLLDVLEDCKLEASASFIWSYGADHGAFGGVTVDAYLKDLPVSRVRDDVLIAAEVNGVPLPRENGFPARLVVPGFYGTNSVKWLTRITAANRRADSPFTTVWYNDHVPGDAGNPAGSVPVWALAPHAIIVSPAPGANLPAGFPIAAEGWAWSDQAVPEVRLTCDNGRSWIAASVEPRQARAWQRFSAMLSPLSPGVHTVAACATDSSGIRQPASGARNAWHRVQLTIS